MRKSIFMVLLGLILAVPAFAINKAPLKELIVASDGEFPSISAALASLPDPNTTPVVIKVMPGMYTESTAITMKSNVYLQGSGRDVTTIFAGINILSLQNTSVSDLTVSFTGPAPGISGIYINSSSPTISNCAVIVDCACQGIEVISASPIIEGNIFDFSTGGYKAIEMQGDSSKPIIRNNKILNTHDMCISTSGPGNPSPTITNNIIEGGYGLELNSMNAIATNNIIRNTGWYGIVGGGPNAVIKDNIVTGNTGGDLCISNGVNVTFNVYDTHCTTTNPTCNFNVKPDGTLHNQCN